MEQLLINYQLAAAAPPEAETASVFAEQGERLESLSSKTSSLKREAEQFFNLAKGLNQNRTPPL